MIGGWFLFQPPSEFTLMPSSTSADRLALWQSKLEAQQLSGLSIAAFCAQNQLSPASFYQWKRKLALADNQPQTASQPRPNRTARAVRAPFVQLAFPAQPTAAPWGIEVLLPDGTIIRLPAHCAETLVSLLPMLRQSS